MSLYLRSSLRSVLLATSLLLLATSSQAQTTYGGRAYGIFVDVPTMGVTNVLVSDTGQLPAAGGQLTSEVLNAVVTGPPILFIPIANADVLTDTTQGGSNQAQSVALATGVVLLADHAARITASVVRAQSNAACVWTVGSSTVLNLTFGGSAVTVTGAPNQVVTIPGVATLTINEQISSTDSNTASMTVNALHLRLITGDEIIVSHAESSVDNCPPPLPVQPTTWSAVKIRQR